MCGNAALWLVEAALLDANPSVRARKLLASQPQYTIDDDPFIKLELLLASRLATSYGAKGAEAKRVLEESLRPPINADAVTAAVKKIGEILGDPIDAATQIHVEQYINDLMTAGAKDAVDTVDTTADDNSDESDNSDETDSGPGRKPGEFGPVVSALLVTGLLARGGGSPEIVPELKKVFSTMVDGIKFYSKKQISAVVLPSINDAVQTWFEENTLDENNGNDIPGVGGLLEELNNEFELDSYWRTVANTSASRAYHYGLFKAGEELGASSFMVVNPMDERTSEICRYLFGQVFPLTDAIDDIESTSNDNIAPFLDPDEVVGLSNEELVAAGISTPPYHWNCRSWAVLVNSGTGD